MQKIISLVLSIIILAGCFTISGYAANKGEENTLRFNKDGKFTILNLSDIQDCYPIKTLSKKYIEDTVDMVKPDLIILTGDNISGYDIPEEKDAELAIREFMDIFEERNIKVAAVFGNHDDEETKSTKEHQLSVYETYDCYIGEKGFCVKDR